MSIKSAKVVASSSVLPRGFTVVGWIEKHPNGVDGSMTVLRSQVGVEVAWDGMAIKGLTRRWRDVCTYEDAANATS